MINRLLTSRALLVFSLLLLLVPVFTTARATGLWGVRVHSELDWHTMKSLNFRVHYHNGLEETAERSLSIAEQVYPVLLKQMGIEETPMIDIIITAEDEIMNGFALWINETFIWVDQNDAVRFLEDKKWLYQVIAHELQHIVFMNASDTWMPEPWNMLVSQTPSWFIEGLAEYYTEKWRPYRADISHKRHIFRNEMDEMDPHHDGYSKILLLARTHGDSAIVKIVEYRNRFGLFNFGKAFKEATGVSVSDFEEEWRRTMNTYYYSNKSQKEAPDELGSMSVLPVDYAIGFSVSPDSSKIAIVGRTDKDQRDHSLIIAERIGNDDDGKSTFEDLLHRLGGLFGPGDLSRIELESKKYRIRELDYGGFHPVVSWSPDGGSLACSKYHFGENGSMIWDIRVFDVESGKGSWFTKSRRATYPAWHPDGGRLLYVAHINSTSNLFETGGGGSGSGDGGGGGSGDGEERCLTDFPYDTQILTPAWSPAGSRIAFASSGPDGNCDVRILDYETGEIRTVTSDPAVDYLPVWHPDGRKISYTSHAGMTPNLFTIDLETGETIRNTDVAEAIWGVQWTPGGNTILAGTLDDVDSVRVVKIDPSRTATTEPFKIRERYTSWRTKSPDLPLEGVDPEKPVEITGREEYRFYKYPRHLTSFILPLNVLVAGTIWSDALLRHMVTISGGTTWDFEVPFYAVSYANAAYGPYWGVNYYKKANWSFRTYDGSGNGLLENFDGWNFWVSEPVNFGRSMSSNHTLTAAVSLFEREFREIDDLDIYGYPEFGQELPFDPEAGKEGLLTLNYRWLNRRPHLGNNSLPKNGWGLDLKADFADGDFYGDFTYRRFTGDSFVNIGAGSGAFYLRGKATALYGDPPAQEYVGFSNDIPVYLFGNTGIPGLPENINPRGWDGLRLGDRVLFGTAEYRFPLASSLPVDFFGFSAGEITGAIFSDFGNAWYSGESPDDFVATAGIETKIAVNIGDTPLCFIAAGYAQTLDEWNEQSFDELAPRLYVRLALVNPF